MSIFGNHRLSVDEVRVLLHSLPRAKAPENLEENLAKTITAQSGDVPHLLGKLPWVGAADDFDDRLMEAIRDRRRPVAPIPASIAGGGASLLNNGMRWIGGALVALGLVVFATRSADLIPTRTEMMKPSTSAPLLDKQVLPSNSTSSAVGKSMSEHVTAAESTLALPSIDAVELASLPQLPPTVSEAQRTTPGIRKSRRGSLLRSQNRILPGGEIGEDKAAQNSSVSTSDVEGIHTSPTGQLDTMPLAPPSSVDLKDPVSTDPGVDVVSTPGTVNTGGNPEDDGSSSSKP